MLKSISPQPTTPLLQQVARFAERRQEVLAGNIANIDTPDYRMRDLPVSEFRHALARAVAQLRNPLPNMASSLGESDVLPPSPTSASGREEDLFPSFLFEARTPAEQPGITFQDGNNRSIEHQFLEMTKNSLLQNFAVELLRGQYDQLQAVISERA